MSREEFEKKARPWWIWVVIGMVALLIGVAAIYGYWVLVDHRFYTVSQGKLYRSAEMAPERLLRQAKAHRIRSVIDLRRDENAAAVERKTLEDAGIQYFHIPTHQVPSSENLCRFLAIMCDNKNLPALVHCEHGVGRTGVFTAVYRMECQGWSTEEAVKEARQLSGFGSFDKGSKKEKFLRGYTLRVPRGECSGACCP
jgi:protein tyrosine/serine phosphatase